MDIKLKPIARKNAIVIQEFKDEILIYDLLSHKAVCLNHVSAMVWNLCGKDLNVLQIADELSKSLKTTVGEDLIFLALDQLNNHNLLENKEESSNFIPKQNRREAIKNIGFTSLIVLPIISSVVAPEAVSAQSAVGLGQTCVLLNPSNCSTGNCLNNGGTGICCASTSTQANAPGYTICSSDSSASVYSVRCCSGNASISPTQSCPNIGDTRYSCSPY